MKKHRSQSPASKLVLRKEVVVVLRDDHLRQVGGAARNVEEPGTTWNVACNTLMRADD